MESERNPASEKIKSYYNESIKEVNEDDGIKKGKIMNILAEDHGKAMTAHSAEYTKLLEEYIKNSKETSSQKRTFKNAFFWVAILTLCLSFLLFAGICVYFSVQDFSQIDVEDFAGLVSSLVGLLSLYIIIPKIIAEYLFNVKEDKHMAKIVKSVQKYDAKVFANINADNKTLLKEKEADKAEKAFMSDLKKELKEEGSGGAGKLEKTK